MTGTPPDAVAELRAAVAVLSPAELGRARHAAQTACNWLAGSRAMQAEMAATVLALILSDLGAVAKQRDLSDVLPAIEGLAMYVIGRIPVIVTDLGNADA